MIGALDRAGVTPANPAAAMAEPPCSRCRREREIRFLGMVASLFGAGHRRAASLWAEIYPLNRGECEAVSFHFGGNQKGCLQKTQRPHVVSAALRSIRDSRLPLRQAAIGSVQLRLH